MRIPIVTKLIVITIFLLLAAAIPIAFKSSELFEQVSRQREEDSNRAMAEARAAEVETLLLSFSDKIKIFSTQVIRQNQAVAASVEIKEEIADTEQFQFKAEKDIVSLEIYHFTDGKFSLVGSKVKTDDLKNAKMPEDYIKTLRKTLPFPMEALAEGKTEIQNSTLPDSIPLLSLGIPLFRNTEGKITHVAIADIHLGRIQKAFSQISERTLFLVDKRGITLAHPDENLALTRTTFKDSPIFKMSSDSVMPKGQLRFQDPYNKGFYVGAFSKSFLGVTVVSQADENVILEPAREVARQAFFITGLVLSASIFFIFLFSITLTSPLEKLVELSKQIAKGNFNVYARTIVRSRDEVGSLAKAFDSMTEGLKERDKVKALFGKFHGSSIAEEVMKKEFKMGGSNKEVIVFFSDIRGFTAYSERHSPEEVVEMLNEYFGVMVKIINKNFGVVDKFIGDAIMAVWGAPKSSKRDCTNAVRACLEMRVALEELNKKRSERGQDPILIGMGLHSGRAISGTIGSTERMEYTVIGDTVNMTSRIEASTKAFGVDLLVSELVHKQVDKNFAMEEAGTATVKGKSEPLRLYKVIGYKDAKGTVETVTTNYSEYAPAAAEKIKVAG